MNEPLVVPERYRIRPGVAHRGYVAGILAANVGGAAQVTFRDEPLTERPFEIEPLTQGCVLLDAGTEVADAFPTVLDVTPPPPVPLERALVASTAFPGHADHPLPECVGCGPDRARGDGLRIAPGRIGDTTLVASPWISDDEEPPSRPLVWTALDCAAAWALAVAYPDAAYPMLARLGAAVVATPPAGEPLVVVGWPLDRRDARALAASAVTTADGALVAVARSAWHLA